MTKAKIKRSNTPVQEIQDELINILQEHGDMTLKGLVSLSRYRMPQIEHAVRCCRYIVVTGKHKTKTNISNMYGYDSAGSKEIARHDGVSFMGGVSMKDIEQLIARYENSGLKVTYEDWSSPEKAEAIKRGIMGIKSGAKRRIQAHRDRAKEKALAEVG